MSAAAPVRGGGRPDGYYIDGERIPSVTTINSCMNPEQLFYWHWQNGNEGRDFGKGPIPAAEIGTEVHTMVECTVHGEPVPAPSCLEAMTAYDAWLDWWEGQAFEVLYTELPLVSKRYRFGGTLDVLARDRKGRPTIVDWKSSAGIYGDYLRQVLGGYGLLYEENYAEELGPLEGGFHIVRFDKERGDFEHRHFGIVDKERRAFELLRELYDVNKAVERRAR